MKEPDLESLETQGVTCLINYLSAVCLIKLLFVVTQKVRTTQTTRQTIAGVIVALYHQVNWVRDFLETIPFQDKISKRYVTLIYASNMNKSIKKYSTSILNTILFATINITWMETIKYFCTGQMTRTKRTYFRPPFL